jgi:pimeloyl-ACP methyl ester carboxylesterase
VAECWWWDLKEPLKGIKAGEPFELKVKREAIPIIFIPGIMGSRLKQKQGGKLVWDPDKWHGFWMLMKYGWAWQRGGKKKEQLVGETYKPEFLEVSEDDEDHNEKLPGKQPGEKSSPAERWWGGVMWGAYGGILKRLAARDTWKKRLPVGLFFDLPVYACGFNWTADVAFAADKLAERIDQVIKKHPDQKCRQVILVTHSMGGLVARAACAKTEVAKKVLGVVHGVQPVHGSGAGYWRMKGGFERNSLLDAPTAWVLGTDGEEVTQTLAEMPGGLALLPNKLYGEEWLEFFDFEENRMRKLPASDPYEEIYQEKERYWRLVNPDYLIGPSKKKHAERAEGDSVGADSPWGVYLENLALARTLHTDLEHRLQHEETHYFLGTKVKSAGKIRFERTKYVPSPDYPPPVGIIYGRDGFRTYVEQGRTVYAVRMSRPSDDGDGTVPSGSARALRQQGDSHVFELPGQLEPPLFEFENMKHQSAYQEAEAQDYTVDAILRLCLLRMKQGGQ